MKVLKAFLVLMILSAPGWSPNGDDGSQTQELHVEGCSPIPIGSCAQAAPIGTDDLDPPDPPP